MIPYYWLAEFGDEFIQQFDPATGVENLFSVVQDRLNELTCIGWYPVTPHMFKLIHIGDPDSPMVISNNDKYITVNVPDGRGCDVRIARRNYLSYGFDLRGVSLRTAFVLGLDGEEYSFMNGDGEVITDTNFNPDLEALIGKV